MSMTTPTPNESTTFAESSSSAQRRIDLNIPPNLLILPGTAAFVGLIIGMSRGGSEARLRFLAENAHRQPRTVQGWYFYTKTRNYRVFFAAAKTGAKYSLGLGGATAGFVILKESFRYVRESVFSDGESMSDARSGSTDLEALGGIGTGKGGAKWTDGALAGASMGSAVSILYRLPRPLFIRALILGSVLGGCTSELERVQRYIGQLKDEQDQESKSQAQIQASEGSVDKEQVSPLLGFVDSEKPQHGLVDRPLQPTPVLAPDPETLHRSWWDPRGWVGR